MVITLKHRKWKDTVTLTQHKGFLSVVMPATNGDIPFVIKYLNMEEAIIQLYHIGYDVIQGENNGRTDTVSGSE